MSFLATKDFLKKKLEKLKEDNNKLKLEISEKEKMLKNKNKDIYLNFHNKEVEKLDNYLNEYSNNLKKKEHLIIYDISIEQKLIETNTILLNELKDIITKQDKLTNTFEEFKTEITTEIKNHEELLSYQNKAKYKEFLNAKKERYDIQQRLNPNEYTSPIIKQKAEIEYNQMILKYLKNLLTTQDYSTKNPTKKFNELEKKLIENEVIIPSEYYAQFNFDIYERYNNQNLNTSFLPKGFIIMHKYSDGIKTENDSTINIMFYLHEGKKEIVMAIRGTQFRFNDFYTNIRLFINGLESYTITDLHYLQRLLTVMEKYKDYKYILTGHSAGGSIVLGMLLYMSKSRNNLIDKLKLIKGAYVYNPFIDIQYFISPEFGTNRNEETTKYLKDITHIYNIKDDLISMVPYSNRISTTYYIEQKTIDKWTPFDEHTIINFLSDEFISVNLPLVKLKGTFIKIEKDIYKKQKLITINPYNEISQSFIGLKQKELQNEQDEQPIEPTIEDKAKKTVFGNEYNNSSFNIDMSNTTKTERPKSTKLTTGAIEAQEKRVLFNKLVKAYKEKDPFVKQQYDKLTRDEFIKFFGEYVKTNVLPPKEFVDTTVKNELIKPFLPRERVRQTPIYTEKTVDGKKEIIKTERIGESELKSLQIDTTAFKPKAYKPRPTQKKQPTFTAKITTAGKEPATKINVYNVPKKDSDRTEKTIIKLGKELPEISDKTKKAVVKKIDKPLVKQIQKAQVSYKL